MELKRERQFGTHSLGLEISKRNVRGASAIHKFGKNLAVDSAATEDVWTGGGTYYFNAAACTLNIESSASADDTSSTGARTLSLSGLGADWTEQAETINLSGRDIVTSTCAYLRVHRMVVETAGTANTNAGTINAVHNGSGSIIAQVAIGDGQTNMAIFSVPASRTAFVTNWGVGVLRTGKIASKGVDVAFKRRTSTNVLRDMSTVGLLDDSIERVFYPPLRIDAMTDIKVTASAVSNGTGVESEFDMIILDNTVFGL